MFTALFLVKRKEGMSQEEFARYWIEEHTPLTAAVPGVLAYRCYPAVGSDDGTWPPYDGVAILSFESKEAYEAAIQGKAFRAALADAPHFQTTEATLGFHADERIIV